MLLTYFKFLRPEYLVSLRMFPLSDNETPLDRQPPMNPVVIIVFSFLSFDTPWTALPGVA